MGIDAILFHVLRVSRPERSRIPSLRARIYRRAAQTARYSNTPHLRVSQLDRSNMTAAEFDWKWRTEQEETEADDTVTWHMYASAHQRDRLGDGWERLPYVIRTPLRFNSS